MNAIINTFRSSIGKKVLMSATGLAMCIFLVGHLLGNFLLYVGKEEFNAYADFLNSMPLLIVAEIGLLATLIIHVIVAIQLTNENNRARGQNYIYKSKAGRSTWMSAHMIHSGMFTLVFIVAHLANFKFGDWDNHSANGQTLYDLVVHSFSFFPYALAYVVAMILLGLHLHHAVKSAFQTLGLSTSNKNQALVRTSAAFAVFIAVGFSTFPIFFYVQSLNKLI